MSVYSGVLLENSTKSHACALRCPLPTPHMQTQYCPLSLQCGSNDVAPFSQSQALIAIVPRKGGFLKGESLKRGHLTLSGERQQQDAINAGPLTEWGS